jgi:hypothetical protein
MRATISAAVGILAVVLLVAGAASGGTPAKQLDLSSPAAVDAYLRSLGVDPATVVKQVGLHNYAGPSCPGAGWNCTTSTRVVQLSHNDGGHQDEGENEFSCEPSSAQVFPTEDADTCFIMQSGRNNHARCKESDKTTPLSRETCNVTQSGRKNFVEIHQDITQSAGPVQTAQQIAKVTQNAIEMNVSQIHQSITQKTWSTPSQRQDGFQTADVDQVASESQNYSHVHQAMDQSESGAATMQEQNTTPANAEFNCGGEKPLNPNQCANITQDATPGGGINASHIHQRIGERQTSTALTTPSQVEGRINGGQEGDVHQENPTGVGHNLNFPDQDLRQLQSSPGGAASQTQVTDPGCCGAGTQIGGAVTREFIRQATTQSADEPTASQFSSLFGQTHQFSGPPEPEFTATTTATSTPSNSCSIHQHGRNNVDGDTFTASGNSQAECASLVLATECSTAEGCNSPPPPPPPCDPYCVEALRSPLAPTSGLAITMPDYLAEPATYSPPPSS